MEAPASNNCLPHSSEPPSAPGVLGSHLRSHLSLQRKERAGGRIPLPQAHSDSGTRCQHQIASSGARPQPGQGAGTLGPTHPTPLSGLSLPRAEMGIMAPVRVGGGWPASAAFSPQPLPPRAAWGGGARWVEQPLINAGTWQSPKCQLWVPGRDRAGPAGLPGALQGFPSA